MNKLKVSTTVNQEEFFKKSLRQNSASSSELTCFFFLTTKFNHFEQNEVYSELQAVYDIMHFQFVHLIYIAKLMVSHIFSFFLYLEQKDTKNKQTKKMVILIHRVLSP